MTRAHNYSQASAIPFRRRGPAIEFCLITTSGTGRWSIPKGIIDPGDTPEQTAIKECYEEAGLRGTVVGAPLGQYTYRKWGLKLTVKVFMLEVAGQDEEWEEMEFRDRRWVSPDEAGELMSGHPAVHLLDRALEMLQSSRS